METQKYDNTNRGILFVNDKKTEEKQPDFKGDCDIDGVKYWISGWKKETKRGHALSFSFKQKDQDSTAPSAPTKKSNSPF